MWQWFGQQSLCRTAATYMYVEGALGQERTPQCGSGVATPGPTRAQALVKFVCALVKLLNSQA